MKKISLCLCVAFCFGAAFAAETISVKPSGESRAEIQAAIETLAKKGGGCVEVLKGEHTLKGPIHLRSNIELKLQEGSKLVFEDNPEYYKPSVMSSWEGVECRTLSPLIYAFGCTNVSVTGSGMIAPKMDVWRSWFFTRTAHAVVYDWTSTQKVPPEERDTTKLKNNKIRPHLMQFNRCKNVLLDGFKIRESPFWTIHLFLSDGCTVRNLDVSAHGHNNDGIDIEMTRNVLVENCVFDQGDDAIVIKSGRNRDGWRLGQPSENIEIRNCRIIDGQVLLGIGSEMSAGVRNVYMHDCVVESETFNLFYIKTNERRGGFIENIRMENIKAKNVTEAILGVDTQILYQYKYFPTHEVRVPKIKNLTLKNVEVESATRFIMINGDKREPVQDVLVENIKCGFVKKPDVKRYAKNVVLKNIDTKRAKVLSHQVRWINGQDMEIEGKGFADTTRYYGRMPASLTTNVNADVHHHQHDSAGMKFRFVTDADKLHFKWKLFRGYLALDHMPATGVSAIDVYRQTKDGKWVYVKTGRIRNQKDEGALTIPWEPNTPCLVNLPLYNGVDNFELGVASNADVKAYSTYRSGITKPVVFYGTSITQGACASRPGMAYVNIIGRNLDLPIVNLGFSGGGQMELEMSEHLAKIDASCYVIDCLPNMWTRLVLANSEKFIRNLRRLRPDVPIILVEDSHFVPSMPEEKEIYFRKIYEELMDEGFKKLYYVDKQALLPLDGDGTVDGNHPSDHGMVKFAETLEKVLIKVLDVKNIAPKNISLF